MTYYSPRMGTNPFNQSDPYSASASTATSSSSSIGSSRITFSTSSTSSNPSTNSNSSPIPHPSELSTTQPFNPSICSNLVQFKEILKQSRNLDDNLIRSLNKSIAKSRDQGELTSPSLLNPSSNSKSNSSNVKDLGISPYSKTPEKVCLEFWKELNKFWLERENLVRFCRDYVGDGQRENKMMINRDEKVEWGLDPEADSNLDSTSRNSDFDRNGRRKGRGKTRDDWDDRGSRLEGRDEMLKRQMNQELSIERVIRQSSLAAFKSRCTMFQPDFQTTSTSSEQERAEKEWLEAVWQGSK